MFQKNALTKRKSETSAGHHPSKVTRWDRSRANDTHVRPPALEGHISAEVLLDHKLPTNRATRTPISIGSFSGPDDLRIVYTDLIMSMKPKPEHVQPDATPHGIASLDGLQDTSTTSAELQNRVMVVGVAQNAHDYMKDTADRLTVIVQGKTRLINKGPDTLPAFSKFMWEIPLVRNEAEKKAYLGIYPRLSEEGKKYCPIIRLFEPTKQRPFTNAVRHNASTASGVPFSKLNTIERELKMGKDKVAPKGLEHTEYTGVALSQSTAYTAMASLAFFQYMGFVTVNEEAIRNFKNSPKASKLRLPDYYSEGFAQGAKFDDNGAEQKGAPSRNFFAALADLEKLMGMDSGYSDDGNTVLQQELLKVVHHTCLPPKMANVYSLRKMMENDGLNHPVLNRVNAPEMLQHALISEYHSYASRLIGTALKPAIPGSQFHAAFRT